MIVGDSLQEEMFFSFLSALRARFLVHRRCVDHGSNCTNFRADEIIYDSQKVMDVDRVRQAVRDRCDNYCVGKEHEHDSCREPEEIHCGPSLPSFRINFARTDSLSLFNGGYHSNR